MRRLTRARAPLRQTDLYGAPPPPRGREWERLERALGAAGGALEAGADAATAALVTQHLHGHRAVDVRRAPAAARALRGAFTRCRRRARLPPGRAALSPVRLEDALAWMRGALLAAAPPSPSASRLNLTRCDAAPTDMYDDSVAALERATRAVRGREPRAAGCDAKEERS